MKLIGTLAASAVVVLAGCSAFPNAGARQSGAHAAHHPGATAPKVDAATFDQQMETMREMHRKMAAAATPAERAALMKDHMQAMQGGMAMMGRMSGRPMMARGGAGMPMQCGGTPSACGGPPTPKDMAQRMDMMEMMMQMMLDREAAMPPAAR